MAATNIINLYNKLFCNYRANKSIFFFFNDLALYYLKCMRYTVNNFNSYPILGQTYETFKSLSTIVAT